jgi:predicted transposase/invertase (TIGR01784 family)
MVSSADENLPTADKIVRDLFADPDNAIPFFRLALPAPLLDAIDLNRIEQIPGSFIDEKMREYRSDLLFRIPTRSGSFADIYLLFEHKSGPSPRIFHQLLGYLARIYENQERPAPVIPFVFHHGETGWKRGVRFIEEFSFHPDERTLFGRYIPDFGIELFDLTVSDVESMRDSLFLYAYLATILHVDRGDIEEFWDGIVELSGIVFQDEKGLAQLQKLLLYIFRKSEMDIEGIKEPLLRISRQLEAMVMTTAEKLIEKGEKRGIEKGIAKGKLEGKLEDAKRLLELNVPLDTVLKATALSADDLRRVGIIS